jgi:hypothetical protein
MNMIEIVLTGSGYFLNVCIGLITVVVGLFSLFGILYGLASSYSKWWKRLIVGLASLFLMCIISAFFEKFPLPWFKGLMQL